jgi:two-component system phosphate regulon sensor histidine kinase PhoR
MVVANTDLPGRESLVARALARLVEARWLVGAAAVVLLVFTTSGIIGSAAALVLLALFAAAISFVPVTRARDIAAPVAPPAPVVLPAPTVERLTGFEVFADALPEPCFVLDRRGVVRYANARAMALFPLRAGEPLTLRMRVPDLISAFNIVAKGGPPQKVEFAERVPTERWFAAWFAPLGDTGSVLLLVTDMSEQRKTDRVRVDFVANASHELRTPLASLAGFIETLQGPARDDAAARTRFLGIMRDQAERMSRLVNDLLSLSRIEMKAHVRPSERVDLAAVVQHVVDSLEPLARDLDVEIDTALPAEAVEVTGDRDELIQVFENLIENACKYGQSGKRVEVAVVPAQDRRAHSPVDGALLPRRRGRQSPAPGNRAWAGDREAHPCAASGAADDCQPGRRGGDVHCQFPRESFRARRRFRREYRNNSDAYTVLKLSSNFHRKITEHP